MRMPPNPARGDLRAPAPRRRARAKRAVTALLCALTACSGAGSDPVSETWSAAPARTEDVAFGGSPYCDYSMWFDDAVLSLTVVDGVPRSARLTATYHEAAIACPYPTVDPRAHEYAGDVPAPDGGVYVVPLTGAATNGPAADAALIGWFPEPDRFAADVVITRTDAPGALAWTARLHVEVERPGATP